jgi:hypothetical protein
MVVWKAGVLGCGGYLFPGRGATLTDIALACASAVIRWPERRSTSTSTSVFQGKRLS